MQETVSNRASETFVRHSCAQKPLLRRRLLALLAAFPLMGRARTTQALGTMGDPDAMITNLLANLPDASSEEVFEPLLELPGVRLERIVSHGQTTPQGDWYDQEQDEWVMVLAGAARLIIEGEGEVSMGPGDSVFLPAHRRHRVSWTDPEQETVWLALHVWPRDA